MITSRTPVQGTSGPTADSGDAAPLSRILAWLYLIGGLFGLAAAMTLSIEMVELLKNPGYVPTCSLNPVVSCGSVMGTPQAELFGFPNALLGILSFSVIVTAGVALLSGFAAPRWFWLGLQLGTTLGIVFVHWLIYQSLYEIGALCPYCVVVWVVTMPIFWYTTLHNLERGHLPVPAGLRGGVLGLVRFHSLAVVLWYLAVAVAILQAFWSYWSTVL